MFGIDLEGLDELQEKLKEMQDGLAFSTVRLWASRIQSEARSRAHSEDITIEVEDLGGGRFDVNLRAPKDRIAYVEDAVRRNLELMPVTTREVFRTFLNLVRPRKTETN